MASAKFAKHHREPQPQCDLQVEPERSTTFEQVSTVVITLADLHHKT
jgi:hypothetical protein